MKTIIPAAENVVKLLGKAKTGEKYRLMHYVVSEEAEGGVLLFHTLTREMLLLSREEYSRLYELPELYEKWFIVPEETNDMKLVDQVRFTLRAIQKKPEHITGYTIFTTTDCNARCFYCFEKGTKRFPMSEATALKTAEFIAEHCGEEAVRLGWFGGEPLYNVKAIDIITNALKEKKISFSSIMTTNGYLFDDAIIGRAKNLWNLRKVQITLDGTEKVYNQTKNYIYDDTNPFETVLLNIEKCLENEIYVVIRLNVTAANGDDLIALVHQLDRRFGTNKYLSVYAKVIYQITEKACAEYAEVYEKAEALDNLSQKYGLQYKKHLSNRLKLNNCQADNDACVTVLPDGKLGACEHYTDSAYIGDIRDSFIDAKERKSFKEYFPPEKECADCFCYPECIRLKKCGVEFNCTESYRKKLFLQMKERMKNTLYRTEEYEEKADEGHC